MSAADIHFERIQDSLVLASDAARRLSRMLGSGVPFIPALTQARSVLQNGLNTAASAAEDLGVELGDQRWVGPVALLHNAATKVRECTGYEASMVAALTDMLRVRVAKLRNARSSEVPTIRIN